MTDILSISMILRAQWYCPQVNMTWLHHWWVNIGFNNDLVSSGNKPLPWPMLSKICMSLSRSQRVNIFTDSRWTDWFLSRGLHAIQLNFQKTKIRVDVDHTSQYLRWQCRIAISSTLIRSLCHQGYSFALVTPGGACLAAMFCWSCRETVCYARARFRCCECHTRVTVTQNNVRTVASWYK